ncbi:MAG: tail fiber domain-containing protein [Chitinophagales bacterium]
MSKFLTVDLKDIIPLTNVLSNVMALNPVTFRYKDNTDDAKLLVL